MSKEENLCTCCTCGYSWIRGQDGSHSCSFDLQKTINVNNKSEINWLEDILKDIPADRVIDRKSIEHRIEVVKERSEKCKE